jgi:hypothetical protein
MDLKEVAWRAAKWGHPWVVSMAGQSAVSRVDVLVELKAVLLVYSLVDLMAAW